MKITLTLTFLIFISSISSQAQEVRALIDAASDAHPRLFIGPGDEIVMPQDPLFKRSAEHVISLSEQLLDVAPVERIQIGRRLLSVSRTALRRVTYLAMAHLLTRDKRFLERAQTEMLAAARFSDWNPSHFLDVAEMTAALAIGYDWLYDALAPEARAEIRGAIIGKGLKASIPGGSWVTTTNNWNQVCHGGLALGALAVMEDEPELAAQIVERAIANVPIAMAEYAPDGAYPEGPAYWNYGTIYNVMLIAALDSVFDTDFGLSGETGFLASSDYYVHVTGPDGLFFNYSDSGLRGGVSPGMYWFADKRGDRSLLWHEKEELESFLASEQDPQGQANRLFPLVLIWAKPFDEIRPPAKMHWKADGRTPIGLHRSGWEGSDVTFAGIKGGSPGTNHAHMDIGSFVMDADGVRWAVDLGAQNYNELEQLGIDLWNRSQDSERWTVFRLNNLSHNTLVVNGHLQRVDGFAPIVKFSDDPALPYTVVDMDDVYAGQLETAQRGLALWQSRSVLIQDEVKSRPEPATIRWGMVTEAEVTIVSNNHARLTRDGRQLNLRILQPAEARLEIFETETPPFAHDAPNPGTKMIGFRVSLAPESAARLVVLLSPEEATGQMPEIHPLSEW